MKGRNGSKDVCVSSINGVEDSHPKNLVEATEARHIALFSVIMAGIWGTAIYSCHHYIIDVLLGISCALLGWLLFEYGLMKIRGFRNFFDRYYQYIK